MSTTKHSTSARQKKVEGVVRQWQTRLLQLDRRNALLYFATGRRGINITNFAPDKFLDRLSSSQAGLAFTYAERINPTSRDLFDEAPTPEAKEPQVRVVPGELDTDLAPLDLQKRLKTLHKRHREWQEEQGLSVLFVALSFLRWIDEEQAPVCSPLLLVACDLVRESPRHPFTLVSGDSDDLIVNPTLRHKLKSTAGIELPEMGEETIEDYLEVVTTLVEDYEGWSVDRSIVVSTFPFSKLAMWEDLDKMNASGVPHPLVRRLAGDAEAEIDNCSTEISPILTDDGELKGGRLDDLLSLKDQHTVVDADFSQLRAVEIARLGANLVIHGPPGTGKSQTIANIISTLLAEGRHVLFVSEKTAALDVVKRRLTDVGLGGFCLDLHSDRGKKASFYSQLREALDQPPGTAQEFPYERLDAKRSELNTIVRALHEVRQPLGMSVFAVQGQVAAISDCPRLSVSIRDIGGLDGERLRQATDAAHRISRRAKEFEEHHTNRWRVLGPVMPSPLLADTLRGDLVSLRSAVEAVIGVAERIFAVWGTVLPNNMAEAEGLLRLVRHLISAPGHVPPHWLTSGGAQRTRDLALTLRRDTQARTDLREGVLRSVRSIPDRAQVKPWLNSAVLVASGAPKWIPVAGSQWSAALTEDPRVFSEVWKEIVGLVDTLNGASDRLQKMIGVPDPGSSKGSAESAARTARLLLSVGLLPKRLANKEEVSQLKKDLSTATNLATELKSGERILGELFELGVVDRVDEDMLVRYRTDYLGFWRWFRSDYRRDHRLLRGHLKKPGKLMVAAATSAIERALEIKRQRSHWSELAQKLQAGLGVRFCGAETDWATQQLAIDTLLRLYTEFPSQISVFQSILSTPSLSTLEDTAFAVENTVETIEKKTAGFATEFEGPLPDLSVRIRELVTAAESIAVVFEGIGEFLVRPVDIESLAGLLKKCVQLDEVESKVVANAATYSHEIGNRYLGWQTDFDELDAALKWTQDLANVAPDPLPDRLVENLNRPSDPESLRHRPKINVTILPLSSYI